MPADLLRTPFPSAAAALSSALPSVFLSARSSAFLAVLLAPLPVQAQSQAPRVDVCALVACSASGQPAAAFVAPARARLAARGAGTPTTPPASGVKDGPAPATAPRDPWARRFQGRETQDDACLLNFGVNGQLARQGTLDTHVLGRTQAWRAPVR